MYLYENILKRLSFSIQTFCKKLSMDLTTHAVSYFTQVQAKDGSELFHEIYNVRENCAKISFVAL
jgi:hypothetical protein